MKYLSIILFFISSIDCSSQELVVYKDTVNNFSIGIPVGWRYGTLKNIPSIKIFAQEVATGSDKFVGNYNLNIFDSSDSTFENAYGTFITSLSSAKHYHLIDSGNAVINGTKYNWIIETHENSQTPIKMSNYDFMTYKNGTSYILTLVAPESDFEKYKELFDKVANSLKL